MRIYKDHQKECLITGGRSFIAKSLARSLVLQNCHVCLIQQERLLESEENLNKSVSTFSCDINKNLLTNLPKFDYIFHFAGFEKTNDQTDLEFLLLNSSGTKTVLEKAIEDGAKFLLISTIDVYEKQVDFTNTDLSGLDSHTIKRPTLGEARKYAESLIAQYFQEKGLNARIVRVGDCFGPQMDFSSSSQIADLIYQAIYKKKIKVRDDGLDIVYPTFIDDLVYGISKAMFLENSKGKIYDLANPNNETILSFANRLKIICQKNQGEIDIVQSEKKSKESTFLAKIDFEKTQEELGWRPKVGLEEGLEITLKYFANLKSDSGEKDEITPKLGSESTKPHFPKIFILPRGKRLKIAVTFLIFFLLLFSPILSAFLGYYFLEGAENSFFARKFDQSHNQSQKASILFGFAKGGIGAYSSGLEFISLKDRLQTPLKIFGAGEDSSKALAYLSSEGQNFEDLLKSSIKNEAKVGDLNKNLSSLEGTIDASLREISLAKGQLDLVNDNSFFVRPIRGKVENAKNKINKTQDYLIASQAITKNLPNLLGFDGKRNYLLLFQNNYELRPTGGFIGSYGELSFEKGNLVGVKIDDIYNIDGQLKEKFAPPDPIETNLSQDRWYLRDSNWDPDFSKNAKIAEEFYQKETGKAVNGVIAFDVSFVSDVIDSLGSIQVPNHDKAITSRNLFDEAEFASEIDFKPGSTAKKDFLTILGSQLVAKLTGFGPEVNFSRLAQATNKAILEKHLLFYFEDPKLESFIAEKNFGGTLSEIMVKDKVPQSDYLLVVDSNVGANKSNRFLKREISYNPTVQRDGNIKTVLKISYQNNSPAETWPGGTYKNYLRIIVPAGSVLEKAQDGEKIITEEVKSETSSDKQIFAVQIEVGVGQEKEVTFEYSLPTVLAFDQGRANYQLAVQKQPGTENDKLTVNLSFPSYMTPQLAQPKAKVAEQNLKFESQLSSDQNFRVAFTRDKKAG